MLFPTPMHFPGFQQSDFLAGWFASKLSSFLWLYVFIYKIFVSSIRCEHLDITQAIQSLEL